MDDQPVKDDTTGRTAGGQRRPWAPPAIEWEEDFLPYAFSTCGKMPGQGGPCRVHRSS